jgi:voltage-gated potassium channel
VCSSCFWAYAGHLEEEEEDGTFTAVWWDKYPHMNWNDAPLNRRYGLCLYWSVMTMSTIGYGDIEPVTSAERLYTLFIMVLGAGFYGWVIGNISALVAVSDPNTRRRNEEMELVTAYIKERNFPKQLAYRIRRYYKFFLTQKTALNERKILDKLSSQLRKEATDFLVDGVVKEHAAFRNLTAYGLSLLHLVLRPVQIPKGAVLCRCGERSYEGYLILSGVIEVRSKQGKPLAYVESGSLVGELAMVSTRSADLL